MPPDDLAPVIIAVFFIVTAGAVLILRPIAKRLGSVLDALAEEKRRAIQQPRTLEQHEVERLVNVIETLDRRLSRLEERQEFTESLMDRREQPLLER